MKTTKQLANRLREVILDGTWIANTNYKNELESLDWETANTVYQSFNTISALAQHIHYYIFGIQKAFIFNKLEIRDKYSFDFPPIESQSQWEAFLNRFWRDTEKLVSLIEELPEDDLQKAFVNKNYRDYLRNINGIIEHSYYHLGQIVILKKVVLIKI